MGKGKKFITDILDINNNSGSVSTQFNYDPLDIGTFTPTSIVFSTLSQDGTPESVFFKPDGLKMYMIGRSTDDIFEYDLSTAWDLTTVTYLQNFPLVGPSGNESNPYGLYMSPDGEYFYVTGNSRDSVIQYGMSTNWDISTSTAIAEARPLPNGSGGNLSNTVGVTFKPDGTLMFVVDQEGDVVVTYQLSTPWDVTTISFLSSESTRDIPIIPPFPEFRNIGGPFGIAFSDDGTSMFLTDNGFDSIFQFDLSTAWDPTTSTFNGKAYRATEQTDESVISSIYIAESEKKAFTVASGGDNVRQLNIGGLVISASNGEEVTSIAVKGGLNVSTDIISNGFLTANMLSVDQQAYFYSTLSAYSTTNLTTNGGTIQIASSTVYTNPTQFNVLKNLYWGINGTTQTNQFTTKSHNINFLRPIAGPKAKLNIGVLTTGSTDGQVHSGVIDIVSRAQTFSHSGSLDVGRTLKVEGKADYELYTISTATQIFLDNFVEAGASAVNLDSHIPDVGAGWTKSLTFPSNNTRTIQVQPNSEGFAELEPSDTNTQGLIYTCDTLPTSVNYELTATFQRQDNGDDTFHLVVKYKDENNFILLTWSASYANCQLFKIEGGVATNIIQQSYGSAYTRPFQYGIYNSTSGNLSPNMLLKLRFIDNKLMVWNGSTSDFVFRGSFEVDGDFNDGDGGVFHKFGIGIGALYDGSNDDQTDEWEITSFEVNDLGPVGTLDNTTVNYINSGSFGIGTNTPTSTLQVVGLPEHADNAAALAAGLTVGAFYRTGDFLKVVH